MTSGCLTATAARVAGTMSASASPVSVVEMDAGNAGGASLDATAVDADVDAGAQEAGDRPVLSAGAEGGMDLAASLVCTMPLGSFSYAFSRAFEVLRALSTIYESLGMSYDTIQEYIDTYVVENTAQEITGTIMNTVLSDILELQNENDTAHEEAIAELQETLTEDEIATLIDL